MPLIDHPIGNYRFLPGIAPYSCGAVAPPGFEIVHVACATWQPYRDGMETIRRFLQAENRPVAALCGVELRSPKPFSFEGFAEFNRGYAEILKSWGVFVDGVNPVARTNIVPELDPPAEPVLYGFSFARPTTQIGSPTFVVAGAGELPEGVLAREGIIALGDTSSAGLKRKAEFVLGLMTSRMAGLGVDSVMTSAIDVYSVHDVNALISEPVLAKLPGGRRHGVAWHYSRPPIVEIEFEMDVRGVRTELRL